MKIASFVGGLVLAVVPCAGASGEEPKFDKVVLAEGKPPQISVLYVVLTEPKADHAKHIDLVVKYAATALKKAAEQDFEGTTKESLKPKHSGNVAFVVRDSAEAEIGAITGFSIAQLHEIAAAKPERGANSSAATPGASASCRRNEATRGRFGGGRCLRLRGPPAAGEPDTATGPTTRRSAGDGRHVARDGLGARPGRDRVRRPGRPRGVRRSGDRSPRCGGGDSFFTTPWDAGGSAGDAAGAADVWSPCDGGAGGAADAGSCGDSGGGSGGGCD